VPIKSFYYFYIDSNNYILIIYRLVTVHDLAKLECKLGRVTSTQGASMFCMYGWGRLFQYITKVIRVYLLTFLMLLCPSFSSADHFLDDIAVSEADGVYHISITSEIDASERYVRSVITDYIHIYRLSDSIIESRIINTDDDKIQVETLVLCCVPVFCREVTRVEEVNELDSGLIQTRIIPEKSDFLSGEATWQVKSTGHTTRLTYQASLEPDFFIPPILGPQMVIDNMRKEFNITFYRIQHIARINEEREWDNGYEFTRVTNHQREEPCNTALISSF